MVSKNITVYLPCNCRSKTECPLNGKCRKKGIIYKASISSDDNDAPQDYNGCYVSQTLLWNPRGSIEQGNPNTCAEVKLCLFFKIPVQEVACCETKTFLNCWL